MSAIDFELICISDPQAALLKSLKSKDVQHFRAALKNGADASLLDVEGKISAFEVACKTSGCSEFIEECLEHGCDADVPNPETTKFPIHYVVESEDVNNLKSLLSSEQINVNVCYQKRTPVFLLIEQLKDENFNQIFDCLKLLIAHGANLNIPDENNTTPILNLLKTEIKSSKKQEILEYFLDTNKVDVDSFRKGRARTLINKNFPDVKIPDYKMTVDLTVLKSFLESRNEERFQEEFETYIQRNQADNNLNSFLEKDHLHLLKLAVEKGMLESTKKIIAVNPNPKPTDLKGLLAIACHYGYNEILKWLLGEIKDDQIINEDALLTIVVKKIKQSTSADKCPYFKCFKTLLSDPRINVDKTDIKGCSALHFAVKYKLDSATELLLLKSPYIGVQNMFGDLPISEINPKVLEKYLDSCLTTNDKRIGDDEFEINIDFSCLVPPKHKQIKIAPDRKKWRTNFWKDEEMLPVTYISNSTDLKYLLKHPVISSFLFVKWLRLSIFFYLNLLLCTIFFVSFGYYVVGCYGQEVNSTVKHILWVIQFLGATYLLLRELSQFALNPRSYSLSLENIWEIILICLLYTVLFYESFTPNVRGILSSIIILLAAVEFTLLVGSLPFLSISTHMVMLKTVSKNFLKSLVLYSIILIAFAFCFYTLFRETDGNGENNGNSTSTSSEESEEDQFNTFADIRNAILKTLVMLTGEFEAANIKFNTNGVSYIIFILFVFFVSIVLFNLINGLAVSDTQAIKSEAELIGLSQKVQVLARFERAILGYGSNNVGALILRQCLPKDFLKLFPEYLPLNEIIIFPNDSNKIMIPKPLQNEPPYTKDVESSDLLLKKEERVKVWRRKSRENVEFKLNFGCCLVPTFSRMDGNIVKYAKEKIYSNNDKNDMEEEIKSLKQKMVHIECKIDKILDALKKD